MQHPGGFPPLVTEAHGVKLYLSDKSSDGLPEGLYRLGREHLA